MDGAFSVRSYYNCFKEKLYGPLIHHDKVSALAHLWKIKAPSKILFFGWRFILDKLAIKDQLIKRGVLVEGNESNYVFCLLDDETLRHLFSTCEVFKGFGRVSTDGWMLAQHYLWRIL